MTPAIPNNRLETQGSASHQTYLRQPRQRVASRSEEVSVAKALGQDKHERQASPSLAATGSFAVNIRK